MIPGRETCLPNWKKKYTGYIMAETIGQKFEHDAINFYKNCASHFVALHHPFCAKRQAEKLEVSFYSSSV